MNRFNNKTNTTNTTFFRRFVCVFLVLITCICLMSACGKKEEEVYEDPNKPRFEGLSYEVELQIREAYCKILNADIADEKYHVKVDEFRFNAFYGYYYGYPVVDRIGYGWGVYFPGYIDGILFTCASVFEIKIFIDNELVDLVEAYNDGILTREDIRAIQTKRLAGSELRTGTKQLWEGSIDEDFDDQTVIVSVSYICLIFRFECREKTQFETYTADFVLIKAIEIELLSERNNQPYAEAGQVLKVTIADKGKQNVIDAIRVLEDYDFVQSASPNYL